jgi:integrase
LRLISARQNITRTLSVVLTQAVEDGVLAANPALRLGRYYRVGDALPHQIEPLTRDEVSQLLQAARENAPREYPLFLCAARTGMRLGELLGLEWGDVDFNGGFIEVRRNRVAGRVTTPKSGKARRIDMSTQLLKRAHTDAGRFETDATTRAVSSPLQLAWTISKNENDPNRLANSRQCAPKYHAAPDPARSPTPAQTNSEYPATKGFGTFKM